MAFLHRENTLATVNNLPSPQAQPRVKKISYINLKDSPYQYREIRREDTEFLAASIQSSGQVIVPLTVYAAGDNENYIIKTGHHRAAACRYLVEEKGLKKYAMLPCLVEPWESEALTEIEVLGSNHFIPETEAEKMYASARYAELIQKNPEVKERLKTEVGGSRTVEIIANKTGRSKSSVIEDLQLNNKLSETAKDAFKSESLTRKAALELTKLDPLVQDELIASGNTTYKAIKQATSDKTEKTPRYRMVNIEDLAPDYSAKAGEETKKTVSVKDVSPDSAKLLVDNYKEKLTRSQSASEEEKLELKIIITALEFYSRNG